MGNKRITNPTSLSSPTPRTFKYIPVNVLNYINEYKAIELDNYIIAISNRYGLEEEEFGKYLSDIYLNIDFGNVNDPVVYMKAICSREALKQKDTYRKKYKVGMFNSLYEALEKQGIKGETKDYFYLEMLENHLINEFLTQEEVKQLNHNVIDYMSEKCEHELSKFIEYVKHSRYVKNHANVPYDVFEKEAEKCAGEWNELTKEVFENE